MYLYILKTIIQKRKQKMKRDRQPERETDESQLIRFSSWFYGPTDGPPPLVAELVGGLTSHKLRRIDHRRNTIHNSTRSKPLCTHTFKHAHTCTHAHARNRNTEPCVKRLCIDRPERGCARMRPVSK